MKTIVRQLDSATQLAENDYRYGIDLKELPAARKERKIYDRLMMDVQKRGELTWLSENSERPSREDQRMVLALTALIPELNAEDMFFIGTSPAVRHFVSVEGGITGRVQTVMGNDGPKRVMLIDSTAPTLQKWALVIHEGTHYSHRLREESLDKFVATLEHGLGRSVDREHAIAFMRWIEEGYTHWLTLQMIQVLSAPLQSDRWDAARRAFHDAQAQASPAQAANFDKELLETYSAQVAFVRALSYCGGLPAIEDFSVRDSPALMIQFLGGPENLAAIARLMRELKIAAAFLDATKEPEFQQMTNLACRAQAAR